MQHVQRWSAAALLALLVGTSAGLAQAADAESFNFEGTLGPTRVGMTLVVQDGKIAAPSHYFYQKHLTDIPLTGDAAKGVTLTEPGGGTFALQFKGNGSNGSDPLTFDNSVGLTGTWTGKDGKALPVALDLTGNAGPTAPGERWYQDLTSESDAAFEAKVQGFYTTVMAGDRAGAANFVHFPLTVNVTAKEHLRITSPDQLNAHWDKIFTPAWLKQAGTALPHDLAVIDGMAALGSGLAYFSDKGVETINVSTD
ncbi:hypothetical protein [Inquilinus limosus]|uniref:Uncharacterized protein n=1 Tax=Inquilinus limosus MP06 TaxID=1398085 RepID=A0A0A0D107_9PROT|nr:hypothetical protein [Inquilinus limosus]KGM32346.1 hypothetical protein P409_21940 [Inquilinus limosus MP06]